MDNKEVMEKLGFDKTRKVERYLDNLNEVGLRQIALLMLTDDKNKDYIMNCIEEFDRAFRLE